MLKQQLPIMFAFYISQRHATSSQESRGQGTRSAASNQTAMNKSPGKLCASNRAALTSALVATWGRTRVVHRIGDYAGRMLGDMLQLLQRRSNVFPQAVQGALESTISQGPR
jgi:hypothetical protein